MGRLLEALRDEIEALPVANPANPANPSPEIRRFATFAAPPVFQTARLLAALRAQWLPDEWLGLDHGDAADLAALTDCQLSTYAAMLATDAERKAGRVPADETAPALCRSCGPIWLHPAVASVAPVVGGWPRVLGCPWCHVRAAGGYVPRPLVTCGDCQHFIRDAINPGEGMGRCGADRHLARPLPYPNAQRQCAMFAASLWGGNRPG